MPSSLARTRDLISMTAQMPATNKKTHPTGHYHKIPGLSQEWQLSNMCNIIEPSVLYKQKGWKPSTKDAQHWKSKITSSQLERKFEHSMNFCSYVLLSETKSKHPLKYKCRQHRHPWPGPRTLFQRQHNANDKSKTHPTGIIIRFLIPARNDNLAT